MKTLKTLIAALCLVTASQGAFAQDTKIGVLNALQALFNSDAARIVQEELEQEFSADEARAQELSDQLAALSEKFQQDESVMTQEEIRRMNSNAQDLQVQLQLIQERVQKALQEKNQQFLQSMQGTLAQAVSDVVAEGGYDLILNVDSAPYFAPVLDITAKVTAKLNQNSAAAN
ncbi:MAG: OmpH family outer membrane protein [Proteobacteria bacterium]|nr:OmpH family outer membrane protein [Pseudomonadota bacterium]MDA0895319.1 OmpH family outer membrane protein [Pseudomonadota bacterium]MDA1243731.1 OmpH family outer membrane protein [Pseudomonadota bacterium]